ncbi:hypothetical protein VPH35_027331 [Triticum aestivum]|uniref:Uncharacterized protein n=1 Tax=Triticum turgidum subsp. durum TaxID=4567 RepID=A0A9R1PHH9_TRITD|nr:unnamed protein product [Triticum turgidum subsp. durum]
MSSTHRHNNLTVSLFTHTTQIRSISISLLAQNAQIKSRTHRKHTQAWKAHTHRRDPSQLLSLHTTRIMWEVGQTLTRAGNHARGKLVGQRGRARRGRPAGSGRRPATDLRRRNLPCTTPPRPSFTAWRPLPSTRAIHSSVLRALLHASRRAVGLGCVWFGDEV